VPRVPITIMGYKCERCEHEWIPKDPDTEPRVCPKCKSPYWDQARRRPSPMISYEEFKEKIELTLRATAAPLTWTEIRTMAKLPEKFPNNQWVKRMEEDIRLRRAKDPHGIIYWSIG